VLHPAGLNLLLALNLQQPAASDIPGATRNVVTANLGRRDCKVFGEKLLLLVNRGVDPVLPADGVSGVIAP